MGNVSSHLSFSREQGWNILRGRWLSTMLENPPRKDVSLVRLDDLPTEILDRICSVIHTNTDVKSFKLVSRRFDAIASRFILKSVHVSLLPESFDNLAAMSNHPVLSRYVRGLWFFPNRSVSLPSLLRFKIFCFGTTLATHRWPSRTVSLAMKTSLGFQIKHRRVTTKITNAVAAFRIGF